MSPLAIVDGLGMAVSEEDIDGPGEGLEEPEEGLKNIVDGIVIGRRLKAITALNKKVGLACSKLNFDELNEDAIVGNGFGSALYFK